MGVPLTIATALALGTLAAQGGRADIPPPPGFQQQQFVALITAAGFSCSQVASFAPATAAAAEPYQSSGLDPYEVQCVGGGAYLVAIPPRRPPGPPRPPVLGPDGKPVEPPSPVVKPLPK
jgi:hypothetical protein